MWTQVIAVAAFFMISAPAIAQPPSVLAGSWKSAPEELKLSTDFDKSVWGPNATSVRTVALVIQGSGLGALTVTRKVVDGRGRTVAPSMSIEEAQIQRKYPDDPGDHWPLEGLRVKVATFDDGDENTLEVRFEPADGRGSFSETLRRAGRGAAHRTAG